MRPWWAFSRWEPFSIIAWLLIWYAILGPPHGWWWLTVGPAIMLGKYLWSFPWKRWRR